MFGRFAPYAGCIGKLACGTLFCGGLAVGINNIHTRSLREKAISAMVEQNLRLTRDTWHLGRERTQKIKVLLRDPIGPIDYMDRSGEKRPVGNIYIYIRKVMLMEPRTWPNIVNTCDSWSSNQGVGQIGRYLSKRSLLITHESRRVAQDMADLNEASSKERSRRNAAKS